MADDRRDDWRNGVDKKLVDLTSAQRSTDDELDDLDLRYNTLDKIIRGDPENDHIGHDERLRAVETGLRELRAEKIKFKVADTTVQGFKWQFWGLILAAVIPSIIAIFKWDHIHAWLEKKDTDPVDRTITRDSQPKRRSHHGALRPKPLPEPEPDSETPP